MEVTTARANLSQLGKTISFTDKNFLLGDGIFLHLHEQDDGEKRCFLGAIKEIKGNYGIGVFMTKEELGSFLDKLNEIMNSDELWG